MPKVNLKLYSFIPWSLQVQGRNLSTPWNGNLLNLTLQYNFDPIAQWLNIGVAKYYYYAWAKWFLIA
jgi:hypothetical protein